jgi:hypothetical protein
VLRDTILSSLGLTGTAVWLYIAIVAFYHATARHAQSLRQSCADVNEMLGLGKGGEL